MEKNHEKNKLFSNPLVRILLGVLVCLGVVIIGQEIAGKFLMSTGLDRDYRNLLKGLVVSLLAIASYRTFFRLIEKRAITEISLNGLAKNLILGVSIGVVLQCLTVLVIYINNGFAIISINPVSFIIIPLAVAFTVAILEEILIRGILFRIIEEKIGSSLALLSSALVFGALHLVNPGSSLVSASCITIEAGFLLGAAYIYARNLWFPIAIHFAWNFMQSGIFGAITSGNEKTNSLLTTQITGSKLITGGEFGPEGTLQATVVGLIATIVLMYLNIKRNKLIKPYWKK
ncbi:CPBP family intramembrane glutamic endopeptidase [Spirosoma pollinicola]|uniref:CPBP family intramembrane metalloprotease domain-containing protein n=1 Tax=Spirosoma pollinicola TaxID=2057025 RepID=A0A2K8YWU0_9BACT|nr:CPBP family intramembrane glutamic endopeptidase [Spirosoma pollinicola]AUD02063.1 CPBP family intramembrane metalloprotease domain-containing protein [Spirosoma pollinicola]